MHCILLHSILSSYIDYNTVVYSFSHTVEMNCFTLQNEWTYPPFSAYMDAKGDIYGRGAQDAKDVSCQYVEAVRRMKQHNVLLKRTLHITFMPGICSIKYDSIHGGSSDIMFSD